MLGTLLIKKLMFYRNLSVMAILYPFSPHGYRFRAGRSAHDAVLQARAYMEEGRRWIVDM